MISEVSNSDLDVIISEEDLIEINLEVAEKSLEKEESMKLQRINQKSIKNLNSLENEFSKGQLSLRKFMISPA